MTITLSINSSTPVATANLATAAAVALLKAHPAATFTTVVDGVASTTAVKS